MSVLGPGPVKTHFGATMRERYAQLTSKIGNSSVYEKYYGKKMEAALKTEVRCILTAVDLVLSKRFIWF